MAIVKNGFSAEDLTKLKAGSRHVENQNLILPQATVDLPIRHSKVSCTVCSATTPSNGLNASSSMSASSAPCSANNILQSRLPCCHSTTISWTSQLHTIGLESCFSLFTSTRSKKKQKISSASKVGRSLWKSWQNFA